MISASQNRRLWAVAVLLGIAFLVLGFRLVDLQIWQHPVLADLAQDNCERSFYYEPRRGDILDRNGRVLATSIPVKTVCADPTLIRNWFGNCQAEVARTVAPWLSLDAGEVEQRIQLRPLLDTAGQLVLATNGQPRTNRYVVLKRKVTLETWQQVTQAMGQLANRARAQAEALAAKPRLPQEQRAFFFNLGRGAIFAEEDQLRVYPNQSLAAHVVGHVGMQEFRTNGFRTMQTVGRDAIEFTLNTALYGVPGVRYSETDRRGREQPQHRSQDVPARPGLNAVLTLDAHLQGLAEAALAKAMQQLSPNNASAIVIEPESGAILAMATLPNYNPNQPGAVMANGGLGLRSAITCDQAEPGSTFKIVVVSGALNDRLVTPDQAIFCENGRWLQAGHYLHDHGRGYGWLTVQQVIGKSSNIGAAKIGVMLGPERLLYYIKQFGFGEKTYLPLLGERSGTVHPLNQWSKLSITRIPMGHEIACTPLQTVFALSALSTGGRLMRPMLVDRLEDAQGRVAVQYRPQLVRQVCTEATAHLMVAALKTAVSTNGTAARAAMENYTVAGKTGTAMKVVDGRYPAGKYYSSFFGFLPADRPALCIGVIIDEPKPKKGYYGGEVAAPVFREIAEGAANYLGLRPDRIPIETLITAGPAERKGGTRTQ